MCEITILFLSLWSLFSVKGNIGDVLFLLLTSILLIACSIATKRYGRRKKVDTSFVRMACILTAVSILVAYPYGQMKNVFMTVLCSIPAFLGMYYIGRVQIYRLKIVGFASLLLIPALLMATRILGKPIENTTTYLSIGNHLLTVALLMFLLPFAMGFCFRTEVDNPFAAKQTALPLNQIALLAWVVVVATLAGIVNNEYGSVLVIGASASVLFLIYGRNLFSKLGFSLSCVVAMIGILIMSEKVMQRWTIFVNLEKAAEEFPMEAQPVKYIIDIAPLYGLFGLGNGTLSKSIYPNITSDYVISGLLCNCGLLFTLLVVVLYIVVILKLLRISTETDYDRIVIETVAIMIFIMGFLTIAGALGSFLLSGVGMPFVSVAQSVNVVLFALMGLVLSIKERGAFRC